MASDPYRGLEPAQLWSHFAALNAIPRPSGHEAKARDYVLQVAESAGAHAEVDERGNTFVRIPPNGSGGGDTVAVQSHLDMVCDSVPDVDHDCEADPITVRRDGDRISAHGTTLGADNGIGVAAALTLITAPEVRHGPLELVFTVDEESGRWGALELDTSLLTARALINLDSEDPEALTIGSAGGGDVEMSLACTADALGPGLRGAKLCVSGLSGGHSGLQIHEPHLNAIKLLAEALERLRSAGIAFHLASVEGGSAHNAIPRDAAATLAFEAGDEQAAEAALAGLLDEPGADWLATEPDATLDLSPAPAPESVIADDDAERLIELLRVLPHGVLAQSRRFPGTVETSANLAVVQTHPGSVRLLTSVRSLAESQLATVRAGIREKALRAGARCEFKDGYPAWEPRPDSPLAKASIAAYQRAYGREPRIDILHAGLECGAFVSRKPGLDAVSFGPLIRDAHTPREHVYASTVETTWQLLSTLLGDLAGDG